MALMKNVSENAHIRVSVQVIGSVSHLSQIGLRNIRFLSTADFRCRDRRSCVSKSLVCDGRSHCLDGSDEINCPSVVAPAARASVLKCRRGSRLCRDGSECVLFSHVCDGERDCPDGSDEEGCGEFLVK